MKFLPVLVPIFFYILLGITVVHTSQPLWLLLVAFSPKIHTTYHIVTNPAGTAIFTQKEDTYSGKIQTETERDDNN